MPGGNADEQARKVAEDKFNFTFFSLTDQVNTIAPHQQTYSAHIYIYIYAGINAKFFGVMSQLLQSNQHHICGLICCLPEK